MGFSAAAIAIVAVASSTYVAVKGQKAQAKASKEANAAMDAQTKAYEDNMAEQQKATEDLQKQATNESQQANDEAQGKLNLASARDRQRGMAKAASGRSDTLLTGPLGISNEPTTARKTLLGG